MEEPSRLDGAVAGDLPSPNTAFPEATTDLRAEGSTLQLLIDAPVGTFEAAPGSHAHAVASFALKCLKQAPVVPLLVTAAGAACAMRLKCSRDSARQQAATAKAAAAMAQQRVDDMEQQLAALKHQLLAAESSKEAQQQAAQAAAGRQVQLQEQLNNLQQQLADVEGALTGAQADAAAAQQEAAAAAERADAAGQQAAHAQQQTAAAQEEAAAATQRATAAQQQAAHAEQQKAMAQEEAAEAQHMADAAEQRAVAATAAAEEARSGQMAAELALAAAAATSLSEWQAIQQQLVEVEARAAEAAAAAAEEVAAAHSSATAAVQRAAQLEAGALQSQQALAVAEQRLAEAVQRAVEADRALAAAEADTAEAVQMAREALRRSDAVAEQYKAAAAAASTERNIAVSAAASAEARAAAAEERAAAAEAASAAQRYSAEQRMAALWTEAGVAVQEARQRADVAVDAEREAAREAAAARRERDVALGQMSALQGQVTALQRALETAAAAQAQPHPKAGSASMEQVSPGDTTAQAASVSGQHGDETAARGRRCSSSGSSSSARRSSTDSGSSCSSSMASSSGYSSSSSGSSSARRSSAGSGSSSMASSSGYSSSSCGSGSTSPGEGASPASTPVCGGQSNGPRAGSGPVQMQAFVGAAASAFSAAVEGCISSAQGLASVLQQLMASAGGQSTSEAEAMCCAVFDASSACVAQLWALVKGGHQQQQQQQLWEGQLVRLLLAQAQAATPLYPMHALELLIQVQTLRQLSGVAEQQLAAVVLLQLGLFPQAAAVAGRLKQLQAPGSMAQDVEEFCSRGMQIMRTVAALLSSPSAVSAGEYQQALTAVQDLRSSSRFSDGLLLLEAMLHCCLGQPEQVVAALASQPAIGAGLGQRLAAAGTQFGFIAGQPKAVWTAWLNAQCAALLVTPDCDRAQELERAATQFQVPGPQAATAAAVAAAGCADLLGSWYPTQQALDQAAAEMLRLAEKQATLNGIIADMPVGWTPTAAEVHSLNEQIKGLPPAMAVAAYRHQGMVCKAAHMALAVRAFANVAAMSTVLQQPAAAAEAYHQAASLMHTTRCYSAAMELAAKGLAAYPGDLPSVTLAARQWLEAQASAARQRHLSQFTTEGDLDMVKQMHLLQGPPNVNGNPASFRSLVHPDKAAVFCRCGAQLEVLCLGQHWDAACLLPEVRGVYTILSKACRAGQT